jgi:hypothetical protein
MAKIVVPKTPPRAFNPQRRPSDLLRKQIEHLEWALLPAAQRHPKRLRVNTVRTEGQAAEYIALLTERVQQAYAGRHGARADAGPDESVQLPKVPKAPAKRQATKRKAAKAKAVPRSTAKRKPTTRRKAAKPGKPARRRTPARGRK